MKNKVLKFNFKFVWILVLIITLSYFLPVFYSYDNNKVESASWTSYATRPTINGTKIQIKTASELAWLANNCNSYSGFSSYTITVVRNIDLSKYTWLPIGGYSDVSDDEEYVEDYFAGTFDGGNCEISGLNIKSTDLIYAGLFGLINGATIKNVVLTNGRIDCKYYAGSVFAYNDTNTSTISNCFNYGVVVNSLGSCSAGGIGGYSWNSINLNNCQNFASIYSIGGEYSSASAGGIIGSVVNGSLYANYCYNTGTITSAGSGAKCYSGGIVGRVYNGTIKKCLNRGAIYASYNSKTYTFIDSSNTVYTDKTKTVESYCGGIAGGESGSSVSIQYCANYGGTSADGKETITSYRQSTSYSDQSFLHYYEDGVMYTGNSHTEPFFWANNTSGIDENTGEPYYEETKTTKDVYIGGIVGYSTKGVVNSYSEGYGNNLYKEIKETTRYFSVKYVYNPSYSSSTGSHNQRIRFKLKQYKTAYSGINGNFDCSQSGSYSTRQIEKVAPDWRYDEQTRSGADVQTDFGEHWATGTGYYSDDTILIDSYAYSNTGDDEDDYDTLSNYTYSIAMFGGWVDRQNWYQYGGFLFWGYKEAYPIVENSLYAQIKGTSYGIELGYSCRVQSDDNYYNIPAQYWYKWNYDSYITENYTYSSSSKSAGDLGSEWASNSKFNNGKPYPKGMYWEDVV